MHFLIAAFGSRGDVQPAVVAARALEAAGHSCECFVPPNLADWVRSFGLNTTGVGLDYAELLSAASEARVIDLVAELPKLRAQVEVQFDALREAATRADVIVGCSVFGAGQLLADAQQVPYRFIALSPFMIPSRGTPAPYVRSQRLPGWLNALSWSFFELLLKAFFKGPVNRRRRTLGLAPASEVWGTVLSDALVLASEPTVFPLPVPLRANPRKTMVQTGGLFLDEGAALSPELDAFLKAGPPPVYLGFGSMGDPRPERTVREVLDAGRRTKTRLLLSRGWAGFTLDAFTFDAAQVLLIGAEPHGVLFPQCAAVVHHGGIGTTHAALRAGVPQLVVPHLLDQYYTAHRLELAGVGQGLGGHRALDGGALAAALGRVLQPEVAERAREVARGLTLDGEARLVAALAG